MAPREVRRSPEEERINIKIRPAMLGNANIEPACSRLYPRPTSKYDGSQVSTTATMAYIAITSIVQLMNVRVRKMRIHGTAGSSVSAAPAPASSRRFPLRI